MKTHILAAIRCSLMFTAVAALSLAYPVKANLITNGGFETGDFTGWTASNGAVVGTFGSVPPHSGSFQAEFSSQNGSLSQSVTTTPGAFYQIDFWLAAGFTPTSFSVSWGGSTIFSSNRGFFGYTPFTFVERASVTSTELLFQFNPGEGGYLLDDVSVIHAANVPDGGSTVSLLGFALFGLATLRRKLIS